jgi:hypothetical protein
MTLKKTREEREEQRREKKERREKKRYAANPSRSFVVSYYNSFVDL